MMSSLAPNPSRSSLFLASQLSAATVDKIGDLWITSAMLGFLYGMMFASIPMVCLDNTASGSFLGIRTHLRRIVVVVRPQRVSQLTDPAAITAAWIDGSSRFVLSIPPLQTCLIQDSPRHGLTSREEDRSPNVPDNVSVVVTLFFRNDPRTNECTAWDGGVVDNEG